MPKVLCMQVDRDIVRLAEVETKNKKKMVVSKVFSFDTPEDAVKDGKVRVSDEVVMTIREGLENSGVTATDVYFVVDSTRILYKRTTLPKNVSKNMIEKTLGLTFTDLFPVDETLYHVSYVISDEIEKDGKKFWDLEVYAIPNDLSESYYQLSVALGLSIKSLSDASHSAKTLFNKTFQNRNVASVNIGETTTSLMISENNKITFEKTIPFGVYNAISTIINSDLTFDDTSVKSALELLYTQNVLMKKIADAPIDDSQEAQLQYDVTTSLTQLVKMIGSTFTQSLQKDGIQIQEFMLTGLGAGIAGISQLLSFEFGIPVTVAQQVGILEFASQAADEPLFLGLYPTIGSIIDTTNFLTSFEKAGGAIAKKKKIDQIFVFTSIILVVVLASVGGFFVIKEAIEKIGLEQEGAKLTTSIKYLKDLGVEYDYNSYATANEKHEALTAIMDATKNENDDMTVFLSELEKFVPNNVVVSNISITPKEATVNFSCQTDTAAARLISILRGMQSINSFECNSVSVADNNSASFTAKFSLKTTEERGTSESEGEENPEVEDNPDDVTNPGGEENQ